MNSSLENEYYNNHTPLHIFGNKVYWSRHIADS
jgi:hypothetical protein